MSKTVLLPIWYVRHCLPFEPTKHKHTVQNLLGILEKRLTNTSLSAHIYQQSADHAFTISVICGVFTVTLICRVDYYLQMLLCLAILMYSVYSELTVSHCDKVKSLFSQCSTVLSLHWLSVKFRIVFKISLLTYYSLFRKQPVYLHSMLAPSLPSHSVRSNKGTSL